MGQMTRTTNPTGLKEIDRKNFVVRVNENGSTRARVFWLESFDYREAGLEPHVEVACIAHAGTTEAYFELGAVSNFAQGPHSIHELAGDKPLRFRFIFSLPEQSLLVAYADGIRARDEAGELAASLVDIEPADLDGIAWKLELPDGDSGGEKPNVLVERALFPSASVAANNSWFAVLVMPEVMRQIARRVSENPDGLEDPESWLYPWGEFLSGLGAELPSVDVQDDDFARNEWIESVVRKFAQKAVLRTHMDAVMGTEGDK
jgi:hypothetical protein